MSVPPEIMAMIGSPAMGPEPMMNTGIPPDIGGMLPPDARVQPDGLEEDLMRGECIDWQGGKPINLKKKSKSGKSVGDELSSHLKDVLESELKNQEKLIANLKRWHKLYKAEKRGARPKPWMADVSIPIARKISDTIFVRIHDMVWNKLRVYLFRPRGQGTKEQNDKMSIWERAFNNYIRNDLNLKEKMVFPTRQGVNSGTGVAKIVYETKNKTIYRYSSEEDKYNPAVKKYRLPGTKDTVVKEPSIVFRGPNVYPIDRARFVISSDALSIEDAYIVGFSFDKRKSQLKTLAARDIYDKDAVDKLTASKVDDVLETRATSAGMSLDKIQYTEPYTLYELWLRFDVDGDGEEDDICVTFHRESGQILKAIYNPIFYGYRPFADFKGASQVEYTYDGEGICEIIEVMSEELDTLHNLMLDRMKLANLPITIAQTGTFPTNIDDLTPGRLHYSDTNPNDTILVLKQPDVTFSIVNEVNWLINQMLEVCGITQLSLGISTAERPVAKETMAVGEEGNKKFKSWTDRAREFYREVGYKLLEAFAQYQPTYEYTDESGAPQSIEMPTGNIRDYLDLDLVVSSEEWNMTIRREVELMRYQLLKDYFTGALGAAQLLVNPQAPSDIKKYVVQINDVSSRALTKVLSNFDDVEPESAVVDMRKSMNVEACIQNSIDIIMAQQQAEMALQQQAQGMLAEQGIMPPEQPGMEEQGQPAPPEPKEGNKAITLNIHEGNKVGKK